jgi:hypothetical protein
MIKVENGSRHDEEYCSVPSGKDSVTGFGILAVLAFFDSEVRGMIVDGVRNEFTQSRLGQRLSLFARRGDRRLMTIGQDKTGEI